MSNISMPTNYNEIANNDLSKINGGASYGGSYTSGRWTKYSAKECGNIADKLTIGNGLLGILLNYIPNPYAKAAIGAVGAAAISKTSVFNKGSRGKGLKTWFRNIPQSGAESKITYLKK